MPFFSAAPSLNFTAAREAREGGYAATRWEGGKFNMMGILNILFAVLLITGTGGFIISCMNAPVWDSECERLYTTSQREMAAESPENGACE